jgi:hypothetical protein
MRERAGARLTAFELMPRFGIDLQLKHGMLTRDPTASHSPWYVLMRSQPDEGRRAGRAAGGAGGGASERVLVTDAVMAESEADRMAMWARASR